MQSIVYLILVEDTWKNGCNFTQLVESTSQGIFWSTMHVKQACVMKECLWLILPHKIKVKCQQSTQTLQSNGSKDNICSNSGLLWHSFHSFKWVLFKRLCICILHYLLHGKGLKFTYLFLFPLLFFKIKVQIFQTICLRFFLSILNHNLLRLVVCGCILETLLVILESNWN